MKKLIAVLSACALITCSFASCGKDEAEESTEKSVSESETETSETESEAETEEDTTEEETTTEAVTEEETTETAIENSAEDIVGMWYTEYEDGSFMGFNVKDNGKIDVWIDLTEMFHFTADGGLFIEGDILESEYIDYNGKNLVMTFNGKEGFNMTKDSGDADSYDGEYTLKSGSLYDDVSNDGHYDIGVIVNGEMIFSAYRDMLTYTVNSGIVSVEGLEEMDYDFDTAELKYEVSGDTLTLSKVDDDSDDMILKKFDFETYKSTLKTSVEDNTSESTSIEKSGNEVSDSETVSDTDRKTDGSIVGMWISPDDASYGFNFKDDMTCGILVDSTETVHFTTDGKFFMSQMTIEPDGISYDGTTLSVNLMGTDILTMKRNDGNNAESYDGSYTIVSGSFYDGMVISMCDSFGIDEENANIYAIVNGEQMYIELGNIFYYTAENGLLTLNGLENFDIPSGSAVEYEFSGDKLIIKNDNGENEILEKVELS